MNAPITITATVDAYLTEYRSPADLVDAVNDPEKHQRVVGSILAYSAHDMSKTWTRVGQAEITVTLLPRDEQVAAAVTALKGLLEKERADSVQRQNAIVERISKLQALTYDEARTVEA